MACKRTPTRVKIILEAIALGATQEHAAKAAGVHHTTLKGWLRDGRRGKTEELIGFVERFEQAIADSGVEMLKCIKAAAVKDWRAAAWLLSRNFPSYSNRGVSLAAEEQHAADKAPARNDISRLIERLPLEQLELLAQVEGMIEAARADSERTARGGTGTLH